MFRHRFHERKFFASQRRVGACDYKSGIYVGNECLCGCRVAGKDRSEARGVHKAHAVSQEWLGTNTSAPATRFMFSGLYSSETYCSSS